MHPHELRACEASTALFVAAHHLERVAMMAKELQSCSLGVSFEAANRALCGHSTPLDDSLLQKTCGLVQMASFLTTTLDEILSEVRPLSDAVQAKEELATRDRGQLPNH
jgi:hypothetical protein